MVSGICRIVTTAALLVLAWPVPGRAQPSASADEESERESGEARAEEPEDEGPWDQEPRLRGWSVRLGAELRGGFAAGVGWPNLYFGRLVVEPEVTVGVEDQGWIGLRLGAGFGFDSTFVGRTERGLSVRTGGPMLIVSPVIVAGLFFDPIRLQVLAGGALPYGLELGEWGSEWLVGVGIEIVPAYLEVGIQLHGTQRAAQLRPGEERRTEMQLGVGLWVGGFLPLTSRE